jgi:hypothetical protein
MNINNFLKDDTGTYSSARFMEFISIFIAIAFSIVSVITKGQISFLEEIIAFASIATGLKLCDRFFEKTNENGNGKVNGGAIEPGEDTIIKKGILRDPKGNLSSGRLMQLLSVFVTLFLAIMTMIQRSKNPTLTINYLEEIIVFASCAVGMKIADRITKK